MKIFSNKKYEELLQKLTDLGLDLEHVNQENDILNSQVNYLKERVKEEVFTTTKLESDLEESKKEVKRLKTLLTRNRINYKKDDKNGTK